MKKIIPVVCMVLMAIGCKKEKLSPDPCIDPDVKDELALCPAVYDPVCGCDGKTYSNSCVATYQGGVTSYTSGQCGCTYKNKGVVIDYTGLDGCGLMIELDNGKVLEPVKLPDGFTLEAGTTVELDYREITTHGSICMAGELADVVCIRKTGCEEIVRGSIDVFAHGQDEVQINQAKIVGDCLEINFSYGGGCEVHEFNLQIQPLFCGTPPLPPTMLQLMHNANGDLCQALLTKTRSYDLTILREAGKSSVEFYLMDTSSNYNQKFVYTY